MDEIKIYISLSVEIQEILADNSMDLYQTLKLEIPELSKMTEEINIMYGENRTRDISLIIISSSAAFYVISQGTVSIINALGNNKKVVVVEQVPAPVVNSQGEIIYDLEGKPVLQWQEKT